MVLGKYLLAALITVPSIVLPEYSLCDTGDIVINEDYIKELSSENLLNSYSDNTIGTDIFVPWIEIDTEYFDSMETKRNISKNLDISIPFEDIEKIIPTEPVDVELEGVKYRWKPLPVFESPEDTMDLMLKYLKFNLMNSGE